MKFFSCICIVASTVLTNLIYDKHSINNITDLFFKEKYSYLLEMYTKDAFLQTLKEDIDIEPHMLICQDERHFREYCFESSKRISKFNIIDQKVLQFLNIIIEEINSQRISKIITENIVYVLLNSIFEEGKSFFPINKAILRYAHDQYRQYELTSFVLKLDEKYKLSKNSHFENLYTRIISNDIVKQIMVYESLHSRIVFSNIKACDFIGLINSLKTHNS